MDDSILSEIESLEAGLKKQSADFSDPVAKLMVTALLHQSAKVRDSIAGLPDRIAERLCSAFVPVDKVSACPSLCLVQLTLKARRDIEPHVIADGMSLSYKLGPRRSLVFHPLYRTLVLPYTAAHLVAPRSVDSGDGHMRAVKGTEGKVWLGLRMDCEVECLRNLSFLIKGTGGVLPRRLVAGGGETELSFASAENMDMMSVMEPFDSQQMTPRFLEVCAQWQQVLRGGDGGRLIYVTDPLRDRDMFKRRAYPKVFQQFLESRELDGFDNDILWLMFDFGPDYAVPDNIEILPCVAPVANVEQGGVMLTQSAPIARLDKADGSFFLTALQPSLAAQRQGFGLNEEEFVIRDFDTASYDAGRLYRDARNLYNRFIDDYQAFVDYHGLKDGESVKSLRETVNRIGKSVQGAADAPKAFDEGTYAMRNVNLAGVAAPVKVSYLTTSGALGNTPACGQVMENKKDAALEKEAKVVCDAAGGRDKASPDTMHELLRYHLMTADRLYTRMDIDAFMRMSLLREFGKDEMRRICYDITVQGVGDTHRLRRGLYIDIRFKDRKNYEKARMRNLDTLLHRQIEDKSCLTMPVIVSLINLEE